MAEGCDNQFWPRDDYADGATGVIMSTAELARDCAINVAQGGSSRLRVDANLTWQHAIAPHSQKLGFQLLLRETPNHFVLQPDLARNHVESAAGCLWLNIHKHEEEQ